MNIHLTKKVAFGVGISLLLIATIPRFASAISTGTEEGNEGKGSDGTSKTSIEEEFKSLREEKRKEAEKLREEKKAALEKQREEKKQNALETRDSKRAEKCEKHQERIEQLMQRIDARSQHNYERLGKITELVKNFYEKKNLSIENYDELVADIETKRAAAKEKLDAMLEHGEFSCEAENPREVIKDYRTDRQTKVEAMKAYREAVRTLLMKVKAAAIAAAAETTPAKTEGDES